MKVLIMHEGKPLVGTATKVPFGNPAYNLYSWQVRREDGCIGRGDSIEEASDDAGR